MDGSHVTQNGVRKAVVLLSEEQIRGYGGHAGAQTAFPGVTIMPSAVIADYWQDLDYAREVGHA